MRRPELSAGRAASGLPSPRTLADTETRIRAMAEQAATAGVVDGGSTPAWRTVIEATVAQWTARVQARCRCPESPAPAPAPAPPRPWAAWLLVGISFVGDIAVLYTSVAVVADSAPGTTLVMVVALAAASLGLATTTGRRLRHPGPGARAHVAVAAGIWLAIGVVAAGLRLAAPLTEGGTSAVVDVLLAGVLLVLYLASGVLAATAAHLRADPPAGSGPVAARRLRARHRDHRRCAAALRFCAEEGRRLDALATHITEVALRSPSVGGALNASRRSS